MKVILLNSPLFRNNQESDDEDYLPPIGLGYIATNLLNNGINLTLIDAVAQKLSFDDLMEILNKEKPEFIASNIFTTNYQIVRELVESITFQTHLIIGGLCTKEIYNEIINWKTSNFIDIVIGDGEKITLDIIKNSIKEGPFKSYNRSRVFKVDGKSKYFINNISDILLNRDLFSNEPFKNHFGFFEANLISSRGCIYNCSFCAAARDFNKDFPVRERDENSITKELIELKSIYPTVKSIRVLDDLFLKSRRNIEKAISIFSNFNFKWRSMAHIRTFSHIDQNKIEALSNSGCNELFIGIESGSSKILKSINKTSNIDIIKKSLMKLFKAKINVKGYFIYGLPNENMDDCERTFKLATEIKKMSLSYNVGFRTSVFQFRPYHGTEIYLKLKKEQPNINIEQVTPNHELSCLMGRSQFNFYSKNYSKVSLETIHDYICRTNALNVPGKLSNS